MAWLIKFHSGLQRWLGALINVAINKIYAANVNTPQKNIYDKLFMRLKLLINYTMNSRLTITFTHQSTLLDNMQSL